MKSRTILKLAYDLEVACENMNRYMGKHGASNGDVPPYDTTELDDCLEDMGNLMAKVAHRLSRVNLSAWVICSAGSVGQLIGNTEKLRSVLNKIDRRVIKDLMPESLSGLEMLPDDPQIPDGI